MAGGFEVFDCPVGKNDSELDHVLSFLAQRLQDLCAHPVAIVWMDPLPRRFTVGETLQRIKTPDSVAFLRPIENSSCRVIDRGARVAQPLCFGQISFAASERLLRALPLRQVEHARAKRRMSATCLGSSIGLTASAAPA